MTQDRTVFPFDFTVFPREQRLELERIIEFVLRRQPSVVSLAPEPPETAQPSESPVDLAPLERRVSDLEVRVSKLEAEANLVFFNYITRDDDSPVVLDLYPPVQTITVALDLVGPGGERTIPVHLTAQQPGVVIWVSVSRLPTINPTLKFQDGEDGDSFLEVMFEDSELSAYIGLVMTDDYQWRALLASPTKV